MDKAYLMEMGLSEEAAQQILSTHTKELAEIEFQSQLREAVTAAGGRSHRAIGAMLDMDAIRSDPQPAKALEQALKQLKTDHGHLFADIVPPYAQDPGTKQSPVIQKPVTLAGAIRQKYERK